VDLQSVGAHVLHVQLKHRRVPVIEQRRLALLTHVRQLCAELQDAVALCGYLQACT